jgi:two-component system KDP operon response regulator KdpE
VTRVLVVDDDPALLRALRIGLEARAFDVTVARTGAEGLSRAAQAMPDLIVLDLGLPDIDGVEVCKRLRQWTDVPVIVLSALDSEDRKVLALDSGADDYVTKPFGMQELEARLRVALRHAAARNPEAPQATMTVGPIQVDIASRLVQVEETPIELTAREFDLLAFLARNAGKVCTHRTILREVWGPGYGNETHYLRVYASRLRHKRPAQAPGSFGGAASGHGGGAVLAPPVPGEGPTLGGEAQGPVSGGTGVAGGTGHDDGGY